MSTLEIGGNLKLMGSKPFDVMIDESSFEIAQLTSTGAGWVSAWFKFAFDITLLKGFLSAFVFASSGPALAFV